MSDVQQNTLSLTFGGQCVDSGRQESKYSLYIELSIYFTGVAQHAETNGHNEITNGFVHLAITKPVRIT